MFFTAPKNCAKRPAFPLHYELSETKKWCRSLISMNFAKGIMEAFFVPIKINKMAII